ncbi:MAG TPA: cbb3-type cytochrome c oxidase subunit II [Bacteroidales bacterium]|nr:cbb3-type cytochrome c oxidase subunit II [Bacteroidales bacterium]
MKMTPSIFFGGSILVWAASISIMVVFPVISMKNKPSDTWRPMTEKEKEGLKLYVDNGCSYCHSMYIRRVDWGIGAERIAQPGDYYDQRPAILGSERTGPDLSQEGGEHPDDWHKAHFVNPRLTRPMSVMPSWEFLGEDKIEKLTAYVQYMGGKRADVRVARQKHWNREAINAYTKGPDANLEWLHSKVPESWRKMPNPYPADEASVSRGKNMYMKFCINCHGPIGDGNGRAAKYLNPRPLNFTLLKRHLQDGKYIGGILYYQIMNGITGTSMPYFKKDLESEKIWDLSNYIAKEFIGYTDSDIAPKGIDASYEPETASDDTLKQRK